MAGGHRDFGVFAVRVEHALAGAGWQDSTSQSIRARDIVQHDFAGLGSTALQVVFVDHNGAIAADPAAQHVVAYVTRALRSNPSVSRVVPPRPGLSLSRDGRTGIVTAGAAADPNEMVKAADSLAGPLHGLSRPGSRSPSPATARSGPTSTTPTVLAVACTWAAGIIGSMTGHWSRRRYVVENWGRTKRSEVAMKWIRLHPDQIALVAAVDLPLGGGGRPRAFPLEFR